MESNLSYKSSLFTLLFNDPPCLRELYNALKNANYGADTEITINTLSGVLFMERINDLSFTISDKIVVLIEHQSTINLNMPLRFLMYAGRIYEKIVEARSLYRRKRIAIPRPEFIVLYNGPDPLPDRGLMRLSEAYRPCVEGETARSGLDLNVEVFNINAGHNPEILGKSRVLEDYARFVNIARNYKESLPPQEALKKAIQYSINNHILADKLKGLSSEVINMLFDEWNWDIAREVWREEDREDFLAQGIEQGLAQGREQALEEGIAQGLEQGLAQGREQGIAQGREQALEEGLEQGLAQGREQTRETIARNALAAGISAEMVQKITGLDIGAINGLSK